jgi:hypothetical protein
MARLDLDPRAIVPAAGEWEGYHGHQLGDWDPLQMARLDLDPRAIVPAAGEW